MHGSAAMQFRGKFDLHTSVSRNFYLLVMKLHLFKLSTADSVMLFSLFGMNIVRIKTLFWLYVIYLVTMLPVRFDLSNSG